MILHLLFEGPMCLTSTYAYRTDWCTKTCRSSDESWLEGVHVSISISIRVGLVNIRPPPECFGPFVQMLIKSRYPWSISTPASQENGLSICRASPAACDFLPAWVGQRQTGMFCVTTWNATYETSFSPLDPEMEGWILASEDWSGQLS